MMMIIMAINYKVTYKVMFSGSQFFIPTRVQVWAGNILSILQGGRGQNEGQKYRVQLTATRSLRHRHLQALLCEGRSAGQSGFAGPSLLGYTEISRAVRKQGDRGEPLGIAGVRCVFWQPWGCT